MTGPAPKRPKPAAASIEAGDAIDDEYMQNEIDKNAVNKLTLPILKAWLKSKRLDTTGNKASLVERVEGWFETKMVID